MSLLFGMPSGISHEVEDAFSAIQVWSARVLDMNASRMRAVLTQSQTIANGTDPAAITGWQTATSGVFPERVYQVGSIALGSGGLVTLTRGIYHMQASVPWTANATGFRYVGLFKAGSGVSADFSA